MVEESAKRPRTTSGTKRAPVSPALSADHTLAVFPNAPHTGACSRWSNSKMWSMGSKLGSVETGRIRTPGPGAYSPSTYTFPGAPKYSLSPRRTDANYMSLIPGPGAYDPRNPAFKSRNVALGIKLSYNSPYGGSGKAPNPGPADYNVDACTTFSSPSLTKGGRRKSPAWTFGLKPAYGGPYAHTRKATPGPGTYDLPGAKGRAYSMTPRTTSKGGFVTPGPGAYDLAYGLTRKGPFSAARLSLHSRIRTLPPSSILTPGPGQYEAPQQFWGAPLP